MAAVTTCSLCGLWLVFVAVLLAEGRTSFQPKGGKEKDRCSICKEFVDSFEKVQFLAVFGLQY